MQTGCPTSLADACARLRAALTQGATSPRVRNGWPTPVLETILATASQLVLAPLHGPAPPKVAHLTPCCVEWLGNLLRLLPPEVATKRAFPLEMAGPIYDLFLGPGGDRSAFLLDLCQRLDAVLGVGIRPPATPPSASPTPYKDAAAKRASAPLPRLPQGPSPASAPPQPPATRALRTRTGLSTVEVLGVETMGWTEARVRASLPSNMHDFLEAVGLGNASRLALIQSSEFASFTTSRGHTRLGFRLFFKSEEDAKQLMRGKGRCLGPMPDLSMNLNPERRSKASTKEELEARLRRLAETPPTLAPPSPTPTAAVAPTGRTEDTPSGGGSLSAQAGGGGPGAPRAGPFVPAFMSFSAPKSPPRTRGVGDAKGGRTSPHTTNGEAGAAATAAAAPAGVSSPPDQPRTAGPAGAGAGAVDAEGGEGAAMEVAPPPEDEDGEASEDAASMETDATHTPTASPRAGAGTTPDSSQESRDKSPASKRQKGGPAGNTRARSPVTPL